MLPFSMTYIDLWVTKYYRNIQRVFKWFETTDTAAIQIYSHTHLAITIQFIVATLVYTI